MYIFDTNIPGKPLTNIELVRYGLELLKIPDFRGVFMRDTLPLHPFSVECGIVNFIIHLVSLALIGVLLLQQD